MEIIIPLSTSTSLSIGSNATAGHGYPTATMPKGLVLVREGRTLAEEGVGFGLPVVKQGIRTIFPGRLELESQSRDRDWIVSACFSMDLEEKIVSPRRGSVRSKQVYYLKNSLADLHRRFPGSRRILTSLSNGMRRLMRLETVYEQVDPYGTIRVTCAISSQSGRLSFEADTAGLHTKALSEIIMMNEQGAHHFDLYQDSSGTCLKGDEIGTWDEVAASEASFISVGNALAFSVWQVEGADLFRGRELIGTRLAWSGFGYSFKSTQSGFRYELSIRDYP